MPCLLASRKHDWTQLHTCAGEASFSLGSLTEVQVLAPPGPEAETAGLAGQQAVSSVALAYPFSTVCTRPAHADLHAFPHSVPSLNPKDHSLG